METNSNRPFWKQGRCILGDHAVRMVDAEGKIRFTIGSALAVLANSAADGKLVSSKGVLGAKITRTKSITTAKNTRRLLKRNGRQGSAVAGSLLAFTQCGANITTQRIIPRHTLIGTLKHNYVLLTPQGIDNRRFRERPNDINMNRPHLGAALLAQIIACRFNILCSTTQRHEYCICILCSVFLNQSITATRQLSKLIVTLFKKPKDWLIEVITAGHHPIHMMFLILHRP